MLKKNKEFFNKYKYEVRKVQHPVPGWKIGMTCCMGGQPAVADRNTIYLRITRVRRDLIPIMHQLRLLLLQMLQVLVMRGGLRGNACGL